VHLGGVDEIDATRQRVAELLMRLCLGVLFAPSHGLEAQLGNSQIVEAEPVVPHVMILHRPLPAGRGKRPHTLSEMSHLHASAQV
jgi:hypothetical protein